MKTYGQFCGVAKALDVVGDRWSLLIVRELMLQGPCRYTDLARGLFGIAPNLLADRLRQLEEAGVVSRRLEPPPVATHLFRLTPRGQDLLPVLRELGRWGGPLLMEAGADDVFHTYWMALPIDLYYRDTDPDGRAIAIEVRTGDEPIVLESGKGRFKARRGRADRPDVVIAGPPKLVIGLLSGCVPVAKAISSGVSVEGDRAALGRITAQPLGRDPERTAAP